MPSLFDCFFFLNVLTQCNQQDFPGIYTCTLNDRLDTLFDTIRKSRVHRLVVIDERSHLVGLLSLSDILDYTLNSPLEDEDEKR